MNRCFRQKEHVERPRSVKVSNTKVVVFLKLQVPSNLPVDCKISLVGCDLCVLKKEVK